VIPAIRSKGTTALLILLSALLPARGALGGSDPAAATEASPADPAASYRPAIFERVEEYRLDNGMLFLLLPRPDTPTVSGWILVRVGNVDNPSGRTGLAHMFEHMAFKGTDRIGTIDWESERAILDTLRTVDAQLAREIGLRAHADPSRLETLQAELHRLSALEGQYVIPMEFPRIYDGYTIDFNAWTSVDYTTYFAVLPANHLEVWMLMESERLQHPVFREFPSERSVVMEERREHTEEDPVRSAWELVYSLAFLAHPYRFPTIGYMSDIETLTQEDAEEFYRTYYVPQNCVAALVGNFDVEDAKRMIRDYFGDIPAGPPPPAVTTVEPEPRGVRRAVLRKGTQRRFFLCFPGFDPEDPRWFPAALLAAALERDDTSRLRRRLDIEEHAVGEISVSSSGGFLRYPGVFEIEVEVLEGFTNERIEEIVWEELERIVTEPVTDERLSQIRRSWWNAYLRSIETNRGIAGTLAQQQIVHGDWRRTFSRFEEYARVTADDVTALAWDIFRKERATIVYLEPEEEGGES
jgi:predicted Zn-dependent peptidase